MKYTGFTIVPDFIVREHGAVAGLIFGKIARYCEWSEKDICTASNKRLADELELGESTIRKYKGLLEEEGYLKIEKEKGEVDRVAISQEMVMKMDTPLRDSAPPATKQRGTPLLDSDEEYTKEYINNNNIGGAENIYKLFSENISELTPMLAEQLKAIEQDYPHDWIVQAIQEAVSNNVRKLKYIIAILKRWDKEGGITEYKHREHDHRDYAEDEYEDFIE